MCADLLSQPFTVQAPVLADFWMENFKLQVDARSAAIDGEAIKTAHATSLNTLM